MAYKDDNKQRRLVEFKYGCRYGKFGKTKAYELIAQERIRAYKMGGKTLIDLDSIDEYHALNHGLCFSPICAAAQLLPCAGGRDDWPNAASGARVRSDRLPGCRCRESCSCRPWQAGAAPPRRGAASFSRPFHGRVELPPHHHRLRLLR